MSRVCESTSLCENTSIGVGEPLTIEPELPSVKDSLSKKVDNFLWGGGKSKKVHFSPNTSKTPSPSVSPVYGPELCVYHFVLTNIKQYGP